MKTEKVPKGVTEAWGTEPFCGIIYATNVDRERLEAMSVLSSFDPSATKQRAPIPVWVVPATGDFKITRVTRGKGKRRPRV